MPQVIETTVYQYDELSDSAREKAREWYREASSGDPFWSECVLDDAKEIGALMGIQVEHIYYSGFSSQGDGACFEGRYAYEKGATRKVQEYAPKDCDLHRIAMELQMLQRTNFYDLTASVKHAGRYCHEHSTDIFVDKPNSLHYMDQGCATAEALRDLLRDFMRWIYKRLESEWEYQNSDEQVEEAIRANEYTFTEDGRRF